MTCKFTTLNSHINSTPMVVFIIIITLIASRYNNTKRIRKKAKAEVYLLYSQEARNMDKVIKLQNNINNGKSTNVKTKSGAAATPITKKQITATTTTTARTTSAVTTTTITTTTTTTARITRAVATTTRTITPTKAATPIKTAIKIATPTTTFTIKEILVTNDYAITHGRIIFVINQQQLQHLPPVFFLSPNYEPFPSP